MIPILYDIRQVSCVLVFVKELFYNFFTGLGDLHCREGDGLNDLSEKDIEEESDRTHSEQEQDDVLHIALLYSLYDIMSV